MQRKCADVDSGVLSIGELGSFTMFTASDVVLTTEGLSTLAKENIWKSLLPQTFLLLHHLQAVSINSCHSRPRET